mmetsp:Transcript_15119/g.42989  ORF Transcript_15119/g.42989 Transcript_15119/m.42989 type:complete len:276 (-) Transcript_15119:1276-2103(-)
MFLSPSLSSAPSARISWSLVPSSCLTLVASSNPSTSAKPSSFLSAFTASTTEISPSPDVSTRSKISRRRASSAARVLSPTGAPPLALDSASSAGSWDTTSASGSGAVSTRSASRLPVALNSSKRALLVSSSAFFFARRAVSSRSAATASAFLRALSSRARARGEASSSSTEAGLAAPRLDEAVVEGLLANNEAVNGLEGDSWGSISSSAWSSPGVKATTPPPPTKDLKCSASQSSPYLRLIFLPVIGLTPSSRRGNAPSLSMKLPEASKPGINEP